MVRKPTYEELEKRVKEPEKEFIDHKRQEKALYESEKKYRYVVENVKVGILVVQDVKLVFANSKISDVLGYTKEELTSHSNPFEFIHQDDREMAFERHIKRIEGEEVPETYEFRVVDKDRNIKWVEVNGVRIDWEDQPATLNFFTDISERKRSEEALKEAYDIISKSPAVVFLWKNSEGWPVEFVSENVKGLFGHTAEEFISGKVVYSKTVHTEDLDRVAKEVESFSNERGRKSFTHDPYRIVTKDGKVKWIDDRTYIRRDVEGRITHYQGIVFDITERIEAEEALRENTERIETIIHSMPVGIVIVDEETREIIDANPQATLLIGAPVERIAGHQCHKFICTGEEGKRPISDLGMDTDSSEHILRTADGKNLPIHRTAIPVTIDDRKCLIESFFDISEHKRAELERIEREKMQGVIEMAGAVCHELNQPMQSVFGYSELLIMDMEKGDHFYEHISNIKGQIDRMGGITKKIMRITRYKTKDYLKNKIIDIDEASM